ncbi:hypothetical protein H5410_007058 [Solanum commersonii]|uniref:Uncharacterized protein n=1 Tax=Solanum commersonii TaxID=4109 RepID=A0A9J6ABG1_SOLCO|nr:hypothetical protein H5410_007058 [Solanum commersonii]
MILAGDGESDGFGVGYLVGLASSKLVRFMGCAPMGGRRRTAGLEVLVWGSFGGGVLLEKEENERGFWVAGDWPEFGG